jgi:hypothetical protein
LVGLCMDPDSISLIPQMYIHKVWRKKFSAKQLLA